MATGNSFVVCVSCVEPPPVAKWRQIILMCVTNTHLVLLFDPQTCIVCIILNTEKHCSKIFFCKMLCIIHVINCFLVQHILVLIETVSLSDKSYGSCLRTMC
jgi:hypothetical protein